MATDVILPRVDMDMTTGRISHWFVKAGERVEKGAALFEIETDKAAMEIDAPASGRVQIVVAIGAEVPVGSTVGWILGDDEAEVANQTQAVAAVAEPIVEREAVAPAIATADEPTEIGDIRATPLSRRLAAEHGINLATVVGSGPKGRIQASDIEAKAAETGARSSTSGPNLNGTWLRQGEGEPIVMLHGFGGDLGGWRPFVGRLPASLPIYALDLPGHGVSALGDISGIDDIASAVIGSLAAAGIRGGHLVGHSLGGAVAAKVAANGRFAAKSLFLIAPGGLGPEVNADFINGFAAAKTDAAIGAWMRELVADDAIITPAMIRTTAAARAATPLTDTQSKLAGILFPDRTQGFSILADLRSLTIPVRVIFGKADRIIPASQAGKLDGTTALHLFAGIGHMPQYEASDAVAALLLQHLKSAAA